MTFLLRLAQLRTTKHFEVIFLASRKTLPAEVAHDEACSCSELSLDSHSLADADTGLLSSFVFLCCFVNCEHRPASSCNALIKKGKGLHSPLSPRQLLTNVLLLSVLSTLKNLHVLSDAENPECLQLVGSEALGGWSWPTSPGLAQDGLEKGSCPSRQIHLCPKSFPHMFNWFQISRNSHCLSCVYDLSSLRCTKGEEELVLMDRQGVAPMSSSVGLTRIKHLFSSWTRLLVGNASQNHRLIQKYNCRTFC